MSQIVEFFRESTVDIPLDESEAKELIFKVMKDLGKPEFIINIIY